MIPNDQCARCGKPKSAHIQKMRGRKPDPHIWCYPFTRESTPEESMSEFTPSVASPLERATGSETVSVDGFVAFIGNGYNQRGAFPRNLSELNDDLYEFARAAVLPSPEPT